MIRSCCMHGGRRTLFGGNETVGECFLFFFDRRGVHLKCRWSECASVCWSFFVCRLFDFHAVAVPLCTHSVSPASLRLQPLRSFTRSAQFPQFSHALSSHRRRHLSPSTQSQPAATAAAVAAAVSAMPPKPPLKKADTMIKKSVPAQVAVDDVKSVHCTALRDRRGGQMNSGEQAQGDNGD